jgi:hypothetical protein
VSRYDQQPPHETTVKEAVSTARAIFKFLGYAGTLVCVVWYLRGALDEINHSLEHINTTLQYKASISDVNHAFKTLGDQNRDLTHKDGTQGLLVPEVLAEPTRPLGSPSDVP